MEYVSKSDAKRLKIEAAQAEVDRTETMKDRTMLIQFTSEEGEVLGAPVEVPHNTDPAQLRTLVSGDGNRTRLVARMRMVQCDCSAVGFWLGAVKGCAGARMCFDLCTGALPYGCIALRVNGWTDSFTDLK